MPSSWSLSLRLELQFTGENINVWGDKLNTAIRDIDFSIAGLTTKSLTADYILSTANGTPDEARSAILKFIGVGGFNITVPAVSKIYHVWNATPGILTFTTGAGATAQVRAGEVIPILCDGSNVSRVQPTYFSNQRLQGVADPTGAQDAATKAYVDGTAFSMAAGALPGQTGNDGKFLTTNAGVASWQSISLAALGGVTSVSPSFTGGVTQSGSSKYGVTNLAALNIDFSANDVQFKAISTNSAFTFSGLTAGKAQSVSLVLQITGAAAASWPGGTQYPGGVDPGPTLGNGLHELRLATYDGVVVHVGTVWRALS